MAIRKCDQNSVVVIAIDVDECFSSDVLAVSDFHGLSGTSSHNIYLTQSITVRTFIVQIIC